MPFGIFIAGGSNRNVVSGNDSQDNRRYGIINRRSAGTLLRGNEVEHNVVSSLGPGRGISVEASTNVTVVNNQASDNTPDLFWDGSQRQPLQEQRVRHLAAAGPLRNQ